MRDRPDALVVSSDTPLRADSVYSSFFVVALFFVLMHDFWIFLVFFWFFLGVFFCFFRGFFCFILRVLFVVLSCFISGCTLTVS